MTDRRITKQDIVTSNDPYRLIADYANEASLSGDIDENSPGHSGIRKILIVLDLEALLQ